MDVNAMVERASKEGSSLARAGRVNFSLIDRPDTEARIRAAMHVRACTTASYTKCHRTDASRGQNAPSMINTARAAVRKNVN